MLVFIKKVDKPDGEEGTNVEAEEGGDGGGRGVLRIYIGAEGVESYSRGRGLVISDKRWG